MFVRGAVKCMELEHVVLIGMLSMGEYPEYRCSVIRLAVFIADHYCSKCITHTVNIVNVDVRRDIVVKFVWTHSVLLRSRGIIVFDPLIQVHWVKAIGNRISTANNAIVDTKNRKKWNPIVLYAAWKFIAEIIISRADYGVIWNEANWASCLK